MNTLKNILSQWYKYVLWALLSVFFWGWIFTLVTDARPAHKLVLCVDRPELRDEALADALSAEKPEGIRLIAVHSFDYYIFDTEEMRTADLYIVGGNEAGDYIASFLPLAETGLDAPGETWTYEGVAYGLKVYDTATGEGTAASYICYAGEGETPQDYYLFFGTESAHREDGKALRLAETFLMLP